MQKEDYPYEKCNWKNKSFTDRLIQESQDFSSYQTEAQTPCTDCVKNNTQNNRSSLDLIHNGMMHSVTKPNDIPDICFLAATLRGSSKNFQGLSRYYYCPNANTHKRTNKYKPEPKKPSMLPRRPCLDKNYISMTAKAFNEMTNCFGYTGKKDKERLFSLMNHESAFLLNVRPLGGTARCYGQMQNAAIIDIQSFIHYGHKVDQFQPYLKIYKDALKNCPYLTGKIVKTSACKKVTICNGNNCSVKKI